MASLFGVFDCVGEFSWPVGVDVASAAKETLGAVIDGGDDGFGQWTQSRPLDWWLGGLDGGGHADDVGA